MRKGGKANLLIVALGVPHEDHGQGSRRRLVSLDEGHVARLRGKGVGDGSVRAKG